MMIRDEIIQLIKENAYVSAPITEKTNLYTDLSVDSLSFIALLLEIEEAYSVTFDITEMEMCLQVGQLIRIVENKIKEEHGYDQTFADEPGKLE